MNILKRAIAGLLAAFFVATALVALIPAPKAYAAAVDGLTLPAGLSVRHISGFDSGDRMVIAPSNLQLRFINRAQVEIIFSQDDLINPTSTANRRITDFGGVYIRDKGSSSHYDFRENGVTSRLDFNEDHSFNGNHVGFGDDLLERWSGLTPAQVTEHLKDTYYFMAGDSGGDGVYDSFCETDDPSDNSFILDRTSEHATNPYWECVDSKLDPGFNNDDFYDEKGGFGIRGLEANAEADSLRNFDITHNAIQGGTILETVFGGDDIDKDSFVFCDEGGVHAFALESCSDPRDGYQIDMTPEDFQTDGLVEVTTRSTTGKPSIGFLVAGTDSELNVGSSAGSGGGDSTNTLECETSLTNPLTWLVCPIVAAANEFVDQLDNAIVSELNVNENTYFDEDTADGRRFYEVWTNFRTIGLVTLVIAALVMVISQALAVGPFDAYTVKKVLPRILMAVIFMSLSWDICKFLIAISNDIGLAVRTIIQTPFNSLENPSIGGTTSLLGGLLLGAGALGLGLLGLLSFALTALMAVVVAFLVLTIRKMVIILLVLLAPFAILTYILPNTQKAYKFWWDTFSKALLMFPIIMAFIAVGRVFAKVSNPDRGLLDQIVMLVAYFGPYFALPTAFRLAGGAIATISGLANDRSRGLFDRTKKFRQGQMSRNLHDLQSGNRFRGGNEHNFRGRVNRGLEGASKINQAGFNPLHMRTRMRTAMNDSAEAEQEKWSQESASWKAWSGDDAKVWASRFDSHDDIANELAARDAGRFGGEANRTRREEAVAQIMRTKREVSGETFHRARVRAQAKTGTGYQYTDANGQTQFDASRMIDDINSAYGNDRNGAGKALAEMRGALAQSGQIAGVAGYGTWAEQMENRFRGTVTGEDAHNRIMDDAINSASPGQAIYGKPSSAAAMGAAHARRIQAISNGIAAGTHTEDDLSAAMAGAAGIYDAMSQASPGNASALANELMGVAINGPPLTTTRQRERVHPASGKPILGPDGRPLMETVTETVQPGTVREYIQAQMAGNAEFVNRRRDLSQAMLAQANAAQAAQAGAAGNPMPGAPGNPLGGPPSDRRLKRNIIRLSVTDSGIQLYKFQYLWSDVIYVGVMAQDLVDTHPYALSKDMYGYFRVDYAALGLEMLSFEEWKQQPALTKN